MIVFTSSKLYNYFIENSQHTEESVKEQFKNLFKQKNTSKNEIEFLLEHYDIIECNNDNINYYIDLIYYFQYDIKDKFLDYIIDKYILGKNMFLDVITIGFGEIEHKIKNICKNINVLNGKQLIYITQYINIDEYNVRYKESEKNTQLHSLYPHAKIFCCEYNKPVFGTAVIRFDANLQIVNTKADESINHTYSIVINHNAIEIFVDNKKIDTSKNRIEILYTKLHDDFIFDIFRLFENVNEYYWQIDDKRSPYSGDSYGYEVCAIEYKRIRKNIIHIVDFGVGSCYEHIRYYNIKTNKCIHATCGCYQFMDSDINKLNAALREYDDEHNDEFMPITYMKQSDFVTPGNDMTNAVLKKDLLKTAPDQDLPGDSAFPELIPDNGTNKTNTVKTKMSFLNMLKKPKQS